MAPSLRSKTKPVGSLLEDYAPTTELPISPKYCTDGTDFYKMPPVGSEENRTYKIPISMYKELKPHQKQGLVWLWHIHCSNIPGGIVADDMGLGKTLQTATFLAGLFCPGIIKRAMIISPVSIIASWLKELKKVGLENKVHIYSATGFKTMWKEGGILLISYELYSRQHAILGSTKCKWDYVVLDEAHRIKNPEANVTTNMNDVHAVKKILMTGTPLARGLEDIYGLINFIEPALLGDEAAFKKKYISAVELGQYSNSTKKNKEKGLKALAHCRTLISPYILRRNKSVLIGSGDLPCRKHEVAVWLKLSDMQIELYQKSYQLFGPAERLRPQNENSSFPLSLLFRLISIDPCLLLKIRDEQESKLPKCTQIGRMVTKLLISTDFEDSSYRDMDNSCKMSFVFDLVENMLQKDREQADEVEGQDGQRRKRLKILIFSQHMDVLDIIQEFLLKMENVGVIRIDGSITKAHRDKKIEQFNIQEGPLIFLLSARVGGEGLNLVAATRVIIVDPAWNFSDDHQISDRVYRIGQEEDVVIYRLFTCATFEEHMYNLQLNKDRLAHALIEGMICDSLVRKKDGNVLVCPKSFEHSKICNLMKLEFGDRLGLDRYQQQFLRTHSLVKGITNESILFSKAQPLPDVPIYESSSEDEEAKHAESASGTGKSVVTRNNRLPSSVANATFQEIMEIPADKVALLVGRDGSVIQSIRRSSAAVINLIEAKKHLKQVPYREVNIFGTREEIEAAKLLIKAAIKNAYQNKDSSSVNKITEYVSFPKHLTGKLIGKGGDTVKSMEKRSGARISIIKCEARCELYGPQQAIQEARALILNIIKEAQNVVEPPRPTLPRSGVQAPPRNYTTFSSSSRAGECYQNPRPPLQEPHRDLQPTRSQAHVHFNQESRQSLQPRWPRHCGARPAPHPWPPECGAHPPHYDEKRAPPPPN
ncbi:hypothetical protein ACQJBY_021861 [Aegilops geniculata]